MKTNKNYLIITFVISYFLIQFNLYAQLQIPNSVFSNGGGFISSENYKINCTLGQAFTGIEGGLNSTSLLGFWYTTKGIVTDIQEEQNLIPMEFFLTQNYPNPFNPNTTITYSIPIAGKVSLKIFDVLGGEIATLVNEEMIPGNYTVNVNASNLTSGVYFYRLQAGNFVETKKMILLK